MRTVAASRCQFFKGVGDVGEDPHLELDPVETGPCPAKRRPAPRASPGGKPRSLTKICAGSIFLTSAITRSTSSSFPMMTRPKQFSLIITPFATSYADRDICTGHVVRFHHHVPGYGPDVCRIVVSHFFTSRIYTVCRSFTPFSLSVSITRPIMLVPSTVLKSGRTPGSPITAPPQARRLCANRW